MNKCGICSVLEIMEDGLVKNELLEIFNGEHISSEQAAKRAAQYKVSTSARSIRRHRSETPSSETPALRVERVAPSETPVKAPPGWEPYSEHTESIGKAIVRLPSPNSTHRDLLIASGFNPDEWQIAGAVNTRKWMRYDQEWLYYYKFDVVAGESPEVIDQHVDDLVGVIRAKPLRPAIRSTKDDAFVFAASDWQIGKSESGDGTPQTVARVLNSIDLAKERVLELRKQGRMMPTLLFTGLGDLGEGTCGFYPGQQFLIDRNRRDQGRINRELITRALDTLTPLFDKTIVAVVGGNHGENRSNESKRLTNDADNDDCAYFDAVKEAFDRSGRDDISWQIMEDELSMSTLAGGVQVGLTHGHLFAKGATAQQKAYEWWKGQDFGFQAVRGTRILLTGHFHHFSATVFGSRTHLQTPAMDPGSKWFREVGGESSPPGTLTFRLDGDTLLGWDDLTIIDPRRM